MTFFDNAYEGVPTWDIGRPQGAIVRLAAAGWIRGRVLDVGCGTGENALHLASLGFDVVGVDLARAAIERAQAKATARGLSAAFITHDALRLGDLGRIFETAIDIGLLHSLQPADRPTYAASLRSALVDGGRALVLCWSDRNPFGYGPERVTRGALRRTFGEGWAVESIDPEVLETRLPAGTVHAWLARLRRS